MRYPALPGADGTMSNPADEAQSSEGDSARDWRSFDSQFDSLLAAGSDAHPFSRLRVRKAEGLLARCPRLVGSGL